MILQYAILLWCNVNVLEKDIIVLTFVILFTESMKYKKCCC